MHWKEVLPSNGYTAYMTDYLQVSDQEVLTLLYQPLIGSVAYSLYMTLAIDVQKQPQKKITRIHKTIMTFTGLHLDAIFSERKKLEALGLMTVYREKEMDEYHYFYHLHPPMSAKDFFNDDLLSVFLYNRLGTKDHYRELRQYFAVSSVDITNKENITQGFSEVFTSLHPSELKSTTPEMLEALSSSIPLTGRLASESSYPIGDSQFDFQKLMDFLPSFVPKEEVEKEQNQRLITQLAFMYKLSPEEMANIVQDAMLHVEQLDDEQLRLQAKRRYRMSEADEPPRLGLRKQPEELATAPKEPKTQEEKIISYFETTAPIEYLEELSDGAKVYEGDIDIIERLIFEYKLTPGVVNVLLDYIFMVNDKKLSKALAFKIAGHWKRKNIQTVQDAMALAKKENQKSQSSKAASVKSISSQGKGYGGQVKKEPQPKWMTDENWQKEDWSTEELEQAKREAAKYRDLLKKNK
ncbi:DnaD domain protein [Bacillus sp. A301a_S52]|jgi:replication initiation and membrane attachment protein|nr:DnaD domain protein [Bacillus sp. A301a_S52]